MVAKDKKVAYFAHLTECLNKYQRAFIVNADFVGSKQISDIRIALRGKAELIFGKNTMVRRCIRDLTSDGSHPERRLRARTRAAEARPRPHVEPTRPRPTSTTLTVLCWQGLLRQLLECFHGGLVR